MPASCSVMMYFKFDYFIIVLLILLTNDVLCQTGADCTNVITINDPWRSVHYQMEPNNPQCDERNLKANQWYSFSSNADVEIPTTCVKNHVCGAKVGMWVDLGGQTVTDDGSFIQAHLCGAYNVLEKYDCCVLRTPVLVAKCNGRLVYNILKKIDRCPVSICTQDLNEKLDDTILVESGEVYEESLQKSADDTQTSPTKPLGTSTDPLTPEFGPEVHSTSDASYLRTSESEITSEIASDTEIPTGKATDTDSATDPIVNTDAILVDSTEALTETAVPDLTVTPEFKESSTASFAVISSTSQSSDDDFATTTVETSDSTESGAVDAPMDTTGTFSTEESSPLELVMPLSTTTDASPTDLSSPSADDESSVITDQTFSEPKSTTEMDKSTTPGMDSASTSDETLPQTDDDSSPGSADEAISSSTETYPESSSVENVTDQITKSMEPTSPFFEDISSSTVQEDQAENETPEKTPSHPSTIITTTITTPRTTTLSTSTQVVVTSWRPDVILTETVTLIFRGHLPNATIQVGNFMLSFLRRAVNESEHRGYKAIFELLPHIEVNASCYSINRTCIELTLRSSGREGIVAVFKKLELINFFEENAHYDLVAYCIASEKCEGITEVPESQPSKSQFERNAPVFITVITLCVVCLVVVIVGAFCTRVWKRGTYHAASNVETAKLADNRHYMTETQSPFTDEQIMKDELISNKADIVDKGSTNGSALDGGENSTWVIPLDDAPVPDFGTVKCEDTKL